jgi:hypothetical protein
MASVAKKKARPGDDGNGPVQAHGLQDLPDVLRKVTLLPKVTQPLPRSRKSPTVPNRPSAARSHRATASRVGRKRGTAGGAPRPARTWSSASRAVARLCKWTPLRGIADAGLCTGGQSVWPTSRASGDTAHCFSAPVGVQSIARPEVCLRFARVTKGNSE